jgi:hypothetical protein
MRITVQIVLLFVVLQVSGGAQDVRSGPPSSERVEWLVREVVIPESEAQRGQPEQYEERQFLEKANSFVRMWTAFAKEYNERKTFNVKLASKLTRAFHDLETSNSWPRAAGSKTGTTPHVK